MRKVIVRPRLDEIVPLLHEKRKFHGILDDWENVTTRVKEMEEEEKEEAEAHYREQRFLFEETEVYYRWSRRSLERERLIFEESSIEEPSENYISRFFDLTTRINRLENRQQQRKEDLEKKDQPDHRRSNSFCRKESERIVDETDEAIDGYDVPKDIAEFRLEAIDYCLEQIQRKIDEIPIDLVRAGNLRASDYRMADPTEVLQQLAQFCMERDEYFAIVNRAEKTLRPESITERLRILKQICRRNFESSSVSEIWLEEWETLRTCQIGVNEGIDRVLDPKKYRDVAFFHYPLAERDCIDSGIYVFDIENNGAVSIARSCSPSRLRRFYLIPGALASFLSAPTFGAKMFVATFALLGVYGTLPKRNSLRLANYGTPSLYSTESGLVLHDYGQLDELFKDFGKHYKGDAKLVEFRNPVRELMNS